MSEWEPIWTKDPEYDFFTAPGKHNGFFVASNKSPHFCFFAESIEAAREEALRALRLPNQQHLSKTRRIW